MALFLCYVCRHTHRSYKCVGAQCSHSHIIGTGSPGARVRGTNHPGRVLGSGLGSFERAGRALNHKDIFPGPRPLVLRFTLFCSGYLAASEAGLEFPVLLSHPPKCCIDRHAPPCHQDSAELRADLGGALCHARPSVLSPQAPRGPPRPVPVSGRLPRPTAGAGAQPRCQSGGTEAALTFWR